MNANVNSKETEKIMKYQDLKIEIGKMWSVRGTVIPIIVGALGVVTKTLLGYCALVSQNLDVFNLQQSTRSKSHYPQGFPALSSSVRNCTVDQKYQL